ncbi:MAG: DNA polymerase III subunit beta [Nitrospirota bacterium]
MKLRIARDELLTALQRVQGVVEKRNTMPQLSNILLEAKAEGVDITATDLEIGMRGLYKASVEEPGSITLSARKLFEILKELPEGEVELAVGDNNWATLCAGKSQFKIVGLPSSDYPALPAIEREGLTPLAGAGLLELIRKTLFAVGDNDARYILNGLLVTLVTAEKKTTLRLVGTDGHRLALAEQELPGAGKEAPKEIKAIVPKKAAQEMRRLLEEGDGEPQIGFTKNLLIFRRSGLLLTSRLMEGNYPNYQQVIPKEKDQDKRATVERVALEGALRRVAVLSRDKTNAVKLTFATGRLTLFSSNPDFGEATEELTARYTGDAVTTGFNARYLLDVLGVMDGESVSMQMETPLSPCLIREPGNAGFTCVVMPIKV